MRVKAFFKHLKEKVIESFKFVFQPPAKPKRNEFTNNPNLSQELESQKQRKKRAKSKQKEQSQLSESSQDSDRITEEQVRTFYSNTNWGS